MGGGGGEGGGGRGEREKCVMELEGVVRRITNHATVSHDYDFFPP